MKIQLYMERHACVFMYEAILDEVSGHVFIVIG